MRHNNRFDPEKSKQLARQKYAERKINKFVKWSWEMKGRVNYKELVELQDEYNIKVYG